MDEEKFRLVEYQELRKEIMDVRERIFKLIGYGIVSVPAFSILAKNLNIEIIFTILPIITISIAILYLAENHSLMRCGRYIRYNIENQLPKYKGWESWLESSDKSSPRVVDTYVSYVFYLLFFIYYAGSTYLAVEYVYKNFSSVYHYILLSLYILIGVWFVIFFIKNVRTSSSTEFDQ